MDKKQKGLVALLIVTNVLLFGSGMYYGISLDSERIVYIIDEIDIPSIIMYSAIGYVNETIWNYAWNGRPNVTTVLQPIWNNESYLALVTFSNADRNECNLTIHVDYSDGYSSENTSLVGVRLEGYNENGAYFAISRFHITGTISSENHLNVWLFLQGKMVLDGILMSSMLNVTYTVSE